MSHVSMSVCHPIRYAYRHASNAMAAGGPVRVSCLAHPAGYAVISLQRYSNTTSLILKEQTNINNKNGIYHHTPHVGLSDALEIECIAYNANWPFQSQK